jgi:hypothetical protein
MIFVETEQQRDGRAERTHVREHARRSCCEGIREKHQPSRCRSSSSEYCGIPASSSLASARSRRINRQLLATST